MKLWQVIGGFVTAVLWLFAGVILLVGSNIIPGICFLIVAVLWLRNTIHMLRTYNRIKNEAVEEDETNG